MKNFFLAFGGILALVSGLYALFFMGVGIFYKIQTSPYGWEQNRQFIDDAGQVLNPHLLIALGGIVIACVLLFLSQKIERKLATS
jgi:hypothetical protein